MRLATGSTEYVTVPITVTIDGVPTQPLGDVSLGFSTGRGVVPDTFHPAEWVQGRARLLVGPGGAVELPDGLWRVWWRIDDDPEDPQDEAGWLVVGATGSGQTVATTADLEDVNGPLTSAQAIRAEALLDGLVDALEIRLNRWLWRREVTETHRIPYGGHLRLRQGPVRSITSITVNGTAETNPDTLTDWERAWWPTDADVVVVYEAGDDPSPAVRTVVVDTVWRTITATPAAASGTIKSYSVEGTSITYGDVADGGQGGSGRFKVGDIRAIGRKRRPVLLT